jgi:hypothetical protein
VEVEEKTVGAQTPWEEQSLRRDFYFQASPAGTAELDSQARDGVETEFEMAYWNTVRDSGDADLLQAYLDRYPGGTFAPIAGLLLERMAASQAAAPLADAAGPQSPAGLGDSANAVVAAIAPALGVPANSPPAPATPEPADLARSIQSALLEVGCNPGPVDGLWGRRSQKALEAFATHASVTLADDPISPSTLEMIEAREARVCPLSCGPREEVKNGACVTKTCARGLILNRSGNCVARQATQQGSSSSSSGSSGRSRSSTPDTAEAPEPAEERRNGCVQVFVGTGGLTFGGFGGGDGC